MDFEGESIQRLRAAASILPDETCHLSTQKMCRNILTQTDNAAAFSYLVVVRLATLTWSWYGARGLYVWS